MRVLIVSPYYYPATCFGGMIWSARNLAIGLAGMGVEVEVVTTSANEPQDDPQRIETLDGVVVHYLNRFQRNRWYFSPSLGRSLEELVPRFDLVDIQGVWSWPTTVGSIVARAENKPYIVTPRGFLSPWAMSYKGSRKRPYFHLIEKRSLSRAAAVHCLTVREAEHVHTLVPEARCEVIPNSVSIDPGALTAAGRSSFAARFSKNEKRRVVLYLSRIHKIKGFDLLIPAMARVSARFPDAHLIVAGPDEGGYRREVELLAEKHGLTDAVTFTGLLDGQDKLAAFDVAEVFVLPSYSEALPVVVLEAMACGKPVVITDPCNLTDEVRGADAGLVVDTTVESVADGIAALLADGARARAMGESGRRLVAERFTLDGVSRRMVDLFDTVLEGRERRGE